jgi:hypothetical protein
LDAQQLDDFNEFDPGNWITGPDETGSVQQQMSVAAESYLWISQLNFGYVPDYDEVLALIEARLRARGISD